MKMYWGSGIQLHSFLISALDGGEWSVSRADRFTSGERAHDTHWIEGWVDSRAGLDAVTKRKNYLPLPKSKPGCLTCSLPTVV